MTITQLREKLTDLENRGWGGDTIRFGSESNSCQIDEIVLVTRSYSKNGYTVEDKIAFLK